MRGASLVDRCSLEENFCLMDGCEGHTFMKDTVSSSSDPPVILVLINLPSQ